MKLSEQSKEGYESDDFGKALKGYAGGAGVTTSLQNEHNSVN